MTIFVLFSVVSVANRTSTCHCPDSTFHSHQVNEHQSTSAFTTAVTQRGQLAHFSRKLSLKKISGRSLAWLLLQVQGVPTIFD